MEVAGVAFRSFPSVSGAGIDAHTHLSVFKPSFLGAGASLSGELRNLVKPRSFSGFCDDEQLQYYSPVIRCSGGALKEKEKKMKKRLKLLKGLSKDESVFSDMGFGLDPERGLADQVKGKMISEASDFLLAQLQLLKAEKKEMKRQRKEEKAKLKAVQMQNRLECKENSSSSESSDGECGEVVDMNSAKTETLVQRVPNESPISQRTTITPEKGSVVCYSQHLGQECCSSSEKFTNIGKIDNIGFSEGISLVTGTSTKKIEVCMGGKCKKSGSALLMEEFQQALGGEGAVVGCKCMGKCRSAPNVKVLNAIDGSQAGAVVDDSVRTPTNPLCIGVGLEDVGTIVANFFGGNKSKELGLAAAS